WPGNVRELENVIERGAVLCRGETLGVDLLPSEILAPEADALPDSAGVSLPHGLTLNDAVDRYERELIAATLRHTKGIQKRAAEILGLKATTLNEKIKRLRITI